MPFSQENYIPSIFRGFGRLIIGAFMSVFWTAPILTFWIDIWKNTSALAILGVILFCMGSCALIQYLPGKYYEPKAFESNGRLYEFLGVHLYKKWMINGDYMNRIIRLFSRDYVFVRRNQRLEFETKTRSNEREHLTLLFLSIPAVTYALYWDYYSFAILMCLSNIVINLYPIMVQRYLRLRVCNQFLRFTKEFSEDLS
jgi:hypothetical protein